jgi:hypothetical protein
VVFSLRDGSFASFEFKKLQAEARVNTAPTKNATVILSIDSFTYFPISSHLDRPGKNLNLIWGDKIYFHV